MRHLAKKKKSSFKAIHDCFPTGLNYNYILITYLFVCTIHVVYIVKEVVSFLGLGQLMGGNRLCASALQTSRIVAYLETATTCI